MALWISILIFLGGVMTFFPSFVAGHNLILCFGVSIMLVSVGIGVRIDAFRRKNEELGIHEEVEKLRSHCRKFETDISHLKNVIAKMRSYDTDEFRRDSDLIRKLSERVSALEGKAESIGRAPGES